MKIVTKHVYGNLYIDYKVHTIMGTVVPVFLPYLFIGKTRISLSSLFTGYAPVNLISLKELFDTLVYVCNNRNQIDAWVEEMCGRPIPILIAHELIKYLNKKALHEIDNETFEGNET